MPLNKTNKEPKVVPTSKKIKKAVKRAFRPNNIGKFLVFLAAIALLATSILPYIL